MIIYSLLVVMTARVFSPRRRWNFLYDLITNQLLPFRNELY